MDQQKYAEATENKVERRAAGIGDGKGLGRAGSAENGQAIVSAVAGRGRYLVVGNRLAV